MNPTSHFVIRAVRADDMPALFDIRRQPQVMRYTPAMPSDRPIDMLSRWGTNDHVLVAELDGRVVAYAGLHVRDGKRRHSAWLGIAVHDEFAGRGAGQLLMTALLDLADQWIGLVRVDLEANADNERAIAMYRRCGFVEEGRQKKAYFTDGGFVDAIFMARLR
jgi:L-phenylalanine/L-methionine N-acetyltransferase